MSEWLAISLLTFVTGFSMVIGALIAKVEHISNRWLESELRHTVIAFGGGILVSAVSLVLVHEGIKDLTPFLAILCFSAGGVAFMGVDTILSKMHQKASQLVAMVLDFVPEVIALGALYLLDQPYAILLACMIILQNIPEGFNAYLELRVGDQYKGRTIIGTFFAMSFLGPIAGLSGYFFLFQYPNIISGIMLFAAGGILYLIFQDIAPLAKIGNHRAPALGAVGGFILGMLGKMLITPI